MVKIVARTGNGEMLLGLGVTPRNLELLQAGRPIDIHVDEVTQGLSKDPIKHIVIFFGTDEDAIYHEFRKAGWLTAETEIRTPPPSSRTPQ